MTGAGGTNTATVAISGCVNSTLSRSVQYLITGQQQGTATVRFPKGYTYAGGVWAPSPAYNAGNSTTYTEFVIAPRAQGAPSQTITVPVTLTIGANVTAPVSPNPVVTVASVFLNNSNQNGAKLAFGSNATLTTAITPCAPPVPGNTAPELTVPPTTTAEATGPSTPVTFSPAPSAFDAEDNALSLPLAVVCTPASGTGFALGTTPVSCSVTDSGKRSDNSSDPAGPKTTTLSFNVIVQDSIAPTVTPASVANTTWRNTPLGQEFTASDGGSGLAANQGLDAQGKFTLNVSAQSAGAATPTTATKTVTDAAGNATTRTLSALIDLTKPTISAATFASDGTTAIGPNAGGWFNQTVVVKFTCADGLSGVAICPADVTISNDTSDDGQAVSGTATDNAGNVSDPASIVVRVDKTAPTISAAVSPVPNAAGWHTTNPTVTFTCTGGDCPAPVTVAAETSGQAVSGTVTDRAGNTASASVTVKLDKTAPTAFLTPSPAVPNGNSGWYTGAVSFTPSGSDALSGLAGCTAVAAVTGDTTGVTRTTTCTDVAGNSASASVTVKLDQTAPTISAAPDRAPNGNGWYNANVTVSFTCSDATSGLAGTCPAAQTVSDEGTANISASVTDQAGNAATSNTVEVKLDKTAPAISDSDVVNTAWRNTPLSESFTATDTGSGLANPADAAFTLTASAESPNATTPTVSNRSVTDRAGNTSTRFVSARIDLTDPMADLTASGNIGQNGWYLSDVTFTASGADGLSGLQGCTTPATLDTDSASHTATTTCTDNAGNTAQKSVIVKRDVTKPVPQLAATGTTGDNDWFTGNVTFSTTGSTDATSGLDGDCTTPAPLTTDSASHNATTTCTDKAGNTATKTINVKRDGTPPAVSKVLTPAANAAGWNNTDVAVDYTCAADLSGVVNCPADTTLTSTQTVAAQTVRDGAGNETTVPEFSVQIDKVKPTISVATFDTSGNAISPNAGGWFNQAVVVKFTCKDDNSDFAAGACPAAVTISDDTDADGQNVIGTVTDKAGNTSTAASVTVKVDKTAPTISVSVSPGANGAGWHNSDPTVTFTCADALSGVASCTGPQTVSTEGTSTVTGTATDQAGNTATASVEIKLDKTKPTAAITPSGTMGNNGWYRSAVTFGTSGTDNGSGGVTCTSIATLSADTSGTTVSTTCTDAAGNSQSASRTVKIDQTQPTLAPTITPSVVYLNSTPTVTPGAADTMSGLASASCTAPATNSIGGKSVTCTATDNAGNTNSTTLAYTVVYNFTGFFQPVDMGGVYNTVKVGSAVPVKFKLGGNQGLNIFAAGSPSATPINCSTSAPVDDIEEISAATVSGLQYDATAGQYIYVWKTSTAYKAGSCYQLNVKFLDGTTQTAFFKFK